MLIKLSGGKVYDPAHQIDGKVMDIYIRDGRIVERPRDDEKIDQTYNLAGKVVMAGAIDMHTHIGGGKVNIARMMLPEDHRADPTEQTHVCRSGCGHAAPSTLTTGYRYAEMGYTAAFEPALSPVNARQSHLEMGDTPEIVEIAQLVEPYVDYVSLHMGSYWRFYTLLAPMDIPLGNEMASNAVITKHLTKPTMVVGRIMTLDHASHIVESGQGDMVSMVRDAPRDVDALLMADGAIVSQAHVDSLGAAEGDTLLVAAGSHGKFLARLDLEVKEQKVVDYAFRLIPVLADAITPDPDMAALIRQRRLA